MTLTVERPVAPAIPAVKTVPEVLRHAALIIEERGWCQTDRQNGDGKVCLIGAIEMAVTGSVAAMGELGDFDSYHNPYTAAVDDLLGGPAYWWNDDLGRTAKEVTATLRAAADAAEAAR